MSSLTCALIVRLDAIPPAIAVVEDLARAGHTVALPRGFEFTRSDRDGWVPVTLDGRKTGFDCTISSVDSWAAEDPDAARRLAAIGTHLLEFGARGAESVRALTVVVRALAARSGASGWVEDEVIPADAMPAFLDGIAQSQAALAAEIAALPTPSRAEQDAAFRALTARRIEPAADRRRPLRIALWIGLYVAVALIGWFLAT